MAAEMLSKKPKLFTLALFRNSWPTPALQLSYLPVESLPFVLAGKWPGQCPCREGYAGEKCDRCQFGYKGYPSCVPCDCNPAGSVNEEPCSEACLCKVRVGVQPSLSFLCGFLKTEGIPLAQMIGSGAKHPGLTRTIPPPASS